MRNLQQIRRADEGTYVETLLLAALVAGLGSYPLIFAAGIVWGDSWLTYVWWADGTDYVGFWIRYYTEVPVWFNVVVAGVMAALFYAVAYRFLYPSEEWFEAREVPER